MPGYKKYAMDVVFEGVKKIHSERWLICGGFLNGNNTGWLHSLTTSSRLGEKIGDFKC